MLEDALAREAVMDIGGKQEKPEDLSPSKRATRGGGVVNQCPFGTPHPVPSHLFFLHPHHCGGGVVNRCTFGTPHPFLPHLFFLHLHHRGGGVGERPPGILHPVILFRIHPLRPFVMSKFRIHLVHPVVILFCIHLRHRGGLLFLFPKPRS